MNLQFPLFVMKLIGIELWVVMKKRVENATLATDFVVFLTLLSWFCSSNCIGQENVDGPDSSPLPANEISVREVQEQELSSLKSYLQSNGIAMNKQGIQKYLRRVTDPNPDQAVVRKLIAKLGAKEFQQRMAAERELMSLPEIPIDLLREQSKSLDPEQAFRAAEILKKAVPRQRQTVEQILRAIQLLKLSGLTKEVFAVIRLFKEDNDIVQPAKSAILKTVTSNDIPFLSSEIFPGTNNQLRDFSVMALRQLKDSSLANRFNEWAGNSEFSVTTRLESALALADIGDQRALSFLVDLMVKSDSVLVRGRSAIALRELTGKRFNFYIYDKPQMRRQKAETWRQWIADEGSTATLNFPLEKASLATADKSILLTINPKGEEGGAVIQLDESLNEVWRYKCGYPYSAEKMENGNILIAEARRQSGKNLDRVIEVTPDNEIVREHRVPNITGARPLPNGNFLVTCQAGKSGIVAEICPEGNMVWKVTGDDKIFRHAVRLDNGNTLLAEVKNKNRLLEIDTAGKTVWEYKTNSGVWRLQPLENGNILTCIGVESVGEIDRQSNQVVWRYSANNRIYCTHRTASGDTLVLTPPRIFAVNRNGAEIWSKEISTRWGTIRQ